MKQLRFTLGFIAGALVFGSVGVAAASSSKTIEVLFNVKDVKINNVSKMPEQQPFIYEGTTYVPLRYIAENLGSDVGWDEVNQTVTINGKQRTCNNETSDTATLIGNWGLSLEIDADKKGWDERIENSFRIDAVSGNTLKLSRGDLFNSRVFYDEKGFPKNHSASPYNWESKAFEIQPDNTANIIIITEMYPDKEIPAHLEIRNNQIRITTDENENFFYFNRSPAFTKTE
ncbi:copper amine oxidase N-terminal domain-containing protein [Paenibacillus sp. N3.4]|uniref:copper amine oxidase N-terminal domain-containing protein n=1 Tax=Paenibacillus sp. N3.4 TaxID=2603222 RepID=UPI0011CA834B|nr:copper amine oxidase N-terminal domain-containing protein [Paenibacillus sp. N3.4]TXK71832.1 copper amine oxidase N-terminal domain-containing protein [Paenibacillus sp. N3.4]